MLKVNGFPRKRTNSIFTVCAVDARNKIEHNIINILILSLNTYSWPRMSHTWSVWLSCKSKANRTRGHQRYVELNAFSCSEIFSKKKKILLLSDKAWCTFEWSNKIWAHNIFFCSLFLIFKTDDRTYYITLFTQIESIQTSRLPELYNVLCWSHVNTKIVFSSFR